MSTSTLDVLFSDLTLGLQRRRARRMEREVHRDAPANAAEPDLQDILLDEPPRLVRNTNFVIISIVLVMATLTSIVEVDVVVTAPGRLMADAPPMAMQAMQISIIRELRVKPGDVVRKGEVLATLDPTFTEADRATLLTQQDSLKSQILRIEAELGDEPLRLTRDSPDRTLQVTLYIQRRSQFDTRLKAFDEDVSRYKANISATVAMRDSLDQQLAIAREVEDMRDQLYRRQVGTKLNYLDASVVRLRTEREKSDAINRLVELQHMLATRVVERQIFVDEWRHQLLDELVRTRKDANAIAESLVKAEKLSELVVLKAPEDGVVLDVGKKSIGSVLQGAESFVTLVPSNAPLIADVMINSADIGYTSNGDEVAIKVDAFPYQKHGVLKGHLRAVGEDSSQAGAQGAAGQSNSGLFHRSQISLDETSLRHLPERTRLIPGMALTAEIKVGSRTLMSYFLYPLKRGFSESLREP
ncbi:MAG: hypothetical protein JWM36_585 [Hyphomicrobiales bacterium]|nr:hypothetical protein [Hyphomicrobiales bacterium]